jgi:hypothetical protein
MCDKIWWSYRGRRCCFNRRQVTESDFVSLDKVRASGTSTSDNRRIHGRHSHDASSTRHKRSGSGAGLTRTKSSSSSSPSLARSTSSSAPRNITRSTSRPSVSSGGNGLATGSPRRSSSLLGGNGNGQNQNENTDSNDPSQHPLNHQNHRYRSNDDSEDEQETFVYLTPQQPSAMPSSYQTS